MKLIEMKVIRMTKMGNQDDTTVENKKRMDDVTKIKGVTQMVNRVAALLLFTCFFSCKKVFFDSTVWVQVNIALMNLLSPENGRSSS